MKYIQRKHQQHHKIKKINKNNLSINICMKPYYFNQTSTLYVKLITAIIIITITKQINQLILITKQCNNQVHASVLMIVRMVDQLALTPHQELSVCACQTLCQDVHPLGWG